jgi:hypothetical protein
MDFNIYHNIANRIAGGPNFVATGKAISSNSSTNMARVSDGYMSTALKEGEDPSWPRVKTLYMSKLKPLFRHLEESIRNESMIETQATIKGIVENFALMFKSMDKPTIKRKTEMFVDRILSEKNINLR